MSVISKLFETDYRYTKCDVIFHPGMSCAQSFFHDLLHYMPSNVKFFFPLAMIPFLMRIKRADKNLLRDYLFYFAETTLGGYLIGNSITITICLLRLMLGRFAWYTVGLLPGFITGFWVFVFSDRVARFYSISVAQAALEAVLRNKDNPTTRALQRSRFLQTFLFMICSSVNLQMIREHKFKIFWFVRPPPKQSNREQMQTPTRKEKTKCTHKTTCQNYILNGVKEYFLLGFALENIKILVKKLKQIKSFSDYFKEINFYAISFLVTYVGIYRLSYCIINRYTEVDPDIVHLIAGCLGGMSFVFYPKPLILSYAIVLLCETTWRTLKKRQQKNPTFLQKIFSFPIGRMVFPFTLATMVHNFIFRNGPMKSLGGQIVNGATNSKGDLFAKTITEAVWRNQNILRRNNFMI